MQISERYNIKTQKKPQFNYRNEGIERREHESYVIMNKKRILQGIDDFENNRYYTLEVGDLDDLTALLDEVSDE